MPKIVLTKSQILHVLSAIVLVPLSGVLAGWLAQHFPGLPNWSPKQIADFAYVGASAGLGLAIHYLHGLQIWERTVGRVVDVEDKVSPPVQTHATPHPGGYIRREEGSQISGV